MDSTVPTAPGARSRSEPERPVRLPVPPGLGRFLVLVAVFVCAACGLVYELELVALATYLTGDPVTQASVVLSMMVFAMGIGSLLAKRPRCHAAVSFAVVEAVLAVVGGGSAMALYACYAWLGRSHVALVGFSLAIGVLMGAEVPLLMTLIQRVRRQDAGGAVADLFAADYVGALVGGLAFPFLLLPAFGQLTGALLTGAVNTVAGGVLVLWLFRRDLGVRTRWALLGANVAVLCLLAAGAALTGTFERAARQAMYGPEVRVAVRGEVQEIVLTGSGRAGAPLRMYLDGRLRMSSDEEARYHEALVHPAMAGPHRRVLVLGGGDGLAAREVLRYPGVESVTVVELDPEVVRLGRGDPGLTALNARSLADRRVRLVIGDAFAWLRGDGRRSEPFDVVIADLPDPAEAAGPKLYAQEFYGLIRQVMTPDARLVLHAGPVCDRPRNFWTVDATVRSVGLHTAPYRVPHPGRVGHGSTACDWGFLLAAGTRPGLGISEHAPPLHSLTGEGLRHGSREAARHRLPGAPVSTLIHPRYTA
ncbi:polyamine aminopropyltransferase [Streptomyces palmae]|uniref:Polyamine aminopropyltransferase n=1 Tax=Streptomyces palmae TaxID=1701085 RepID=A0A4Z0HAB4_9ACTN|nr:polyamine aminopropyltransferase [Streptomyces palmae]